MLFPISSRKGSLIPIEFLSIAAFARTINAGPLLLDAAIVLPKTIDDCGKAPLPDSFLSYSIEFAFFPDFGGNATHPNNFSINLVTSLAEIQGSYPIMRVGGNTQDKTTFMLNQTEAIISIYDNKVSLDYPAVVKIGPAFFESYANFENSLAIHGFNFAKGGNCTACIDPILDHAIAACKALGDRALAWEYGNEPDMYGLIGERPRSWNEEAIYPNWRAGKEAINAAFKEHCPSSSASVKYIAPSFAIPFKFMDPIRAWKAGFNYDSDIFAFGQHNYVGVSTDPGLTLRSTLLNNTYTVRSLQNMTRIMEGVSLPPETPFMLTETNSLARQGLPLVSDTFGSALWNVAYTLRAASIGVQRVHMHQGVNYRYGSWQPIETNRSVKATKPAFYGNVASADFVGRSRGKLRVMEIDLKNGGLAEEEAVYAAFVDDALERLAIVNLGQWNATQEEQRPNVQYEFQTSGHAKQARVKRLIADGTDSYSGVTYGGYSYNWELENGRPVRLDNVTDVEIVPIGTDGRLVIKVPQASAAIITLA